jgi:hypothetical protein
LPSATRFAFALAEIVSSSRNAKSEAGEMLAAMEKNPGHRIGGHKVLPPASLDDLGIDKMQSSRWQRVACVDNWQVSKRKAGEMLAAMERRDGGDAARARSHDVTESPPSLDELGIDKMQSSRWQKEASVPPRHCHPKSTSNSASVCCTD